MRWSPKHFDGYAHRPVLYQEIIDAIRPVSGGLYVDATLGAGGHAWGILQASTPDGRLLGLDVDPEAIRLARERLRPFGDRAILVQASYTTLKDQLRRLGWEAVDGIVLDLGMSSMQVENPEKGFSFRQDAPLDMRYDPSNVVRAADLVNNLSEEELAHLIYTFGEERQARRIAHLIVQERPIRTTRQLAEVVVRAKGGGAKRMSAVHSGAPRQIHPATQTFQALRIAVNRELEALEQALPQAVDGLKTGGRLAVISFHSLEDRIVKRFFHRESRDCICPPSQPVCTCHHRALLSLVTRKALRPSPEELAQNPRSRSARLRVAVKL